MSHVRQRTHQVGVRLTPEEYRLLLNRADRLGVSSAAYLRRALMTADEEAKEWRISVGGIPDREEER